jgi:hypothetical protein
VNKQRLQDGDIEAWSYLLRQQPALLSATVMEVTAEAITPKVTRYLLHLLGLTEPITLVGKESTAVETLFYQQYARQLPHLVPHCWSAEICPDGTGWLILDDVATHHPPALWQRADAERMVRQLAQTHAHFWGESPPANQNTWQDNSLPFLLGPPAPSQSVADWRRRVDRLVRSWSPPRTFFTPLTLPEQSSQSVPLLRAYASLQMLQQLGGWPGIIEEAHLEAATFLLHHPDLWLTPLQETAYTLLHGQPGVENWAVSLWEEERLLSWHTAVWGPAPYDLIIFLESLHAAYAHTPSHPSQPAAEWAQQEETLIDSYFLALADHLPSQQYQSRHLRRYTLPAARCLYTLTHWLPTLGDWFMHLPPSRHTWEMLADMDERQRATIGYTPVVAIRPHLQQLFQRFLQAYRLLSC